MTSLFQSPLAFVAWPPVLLLLGIDILLIRRLARADRQWRAEIICLLLAQASALWLVATFFTSGQIGAGDSYSYALQLADFIAQLKHGVFPVFVGQSEFAFNGNIHTLRTAPYYVHLGAALYALTGGHLPVFGLKNLCVIVSALGAATSAYAAVRLLAPAWRCAAPLLAALYVLCPAPMVLLVGYDMYATFMVLPWLPVVWVGIARTLDATENTRPLIVSTAALALVWYAHPAVAAWLTPVWLSALVVRAVLVEKKFHRFLPPLLATAALGWLIAYLFVSVSSLALTYSINIHGDAARAIVSNLQLAGRAAWLPMVNPIGTLGNIQLGYALTVLGLTCLIGVRRSRLPAIFFAAVSVAFFVLLFPLPGLTHAFWSLAPNALVNATNVWPMQRFYPILAAAFPVWAALVLRTYEPCNRTRRIIICALVVGVAWSFWQAEKPRHHAEIVSQSPKASSQLLAPVNVALARSSYLMFDFYPAYYSHGVMEPTFETRLLDSAMNVILENTSALAALKSDTVPVATLKPLLIVSRYADVRRREATFETDGHSQYLLAFTFNGTPNGDIELFGGGLNRHYVLPEFGSAQAFGAGQHSSPYLPICMPPGPPAKITLRTEIPDLVARVFPFHPDELPIQTRSLIPLEISARASQAGFVETPKVFIPGYTATVNGVTTEVIRSHEGLVAVPVLAGPVEVVVRYQGPVALRLAFWFSFAGFALLPLCAVWLWGRSLEKNWLQPAREAP